MNNSEIIANLLLSEGEGKIGNIHENAEQIIINYMEKMRLLELNYFNIENENKSILMYIKKYILAEITDQMSKYDVNQIQSLCLDFAAELSRISCSLYNHKYKDIKLKELFDLAAFLGIDIKENRYQERMGLLKEAVNFIFYNTRNANKCNNSITIKQFMNLINLEASVIILDQIYFSLNTDPQMSIVIDKCWKGEKIRSQKLQSESKKLETIKNQENENLYGEKEQVIIDKFEEVMGFSDKTLEVFIDKYFNGQDELKINNKYKLASILHLSQKQMQNFENIMFFDFDKIRKQKFIKNENCSLFTTPFVHKNSDTNLYVMKYNLVEAAMYLRKRIIYRKIPMKRKLSILIKELRNERELPKIKERILEKGKRPVGINKDFGKDMRTKYLIDNEKKIPHEIDLFYKKDDTLIIYDLKDYEIPFSLAALSKVKKKLNGEAGKLLRLKKLILENIDCFIEALGFEFNKVNVGILLTRDINNVSNACGVDVLAIQEFNDHIGEYI